MTVEYFQVITTECGLSYADRESMNIGDALDIVYTYIDLHNPDRKQTRMATQEDIDRY